MYKHVVHKNTTQYITFMKKCSYYENSQIINDFVTQSQRSLIPFIERVSTSTTSGSDSVEG